MSDFAGLVQNAALRVPAKHRVGSKVFISHVWALSRVDISLTDFKAKLIEAHLAGLLSLSRLDLVEAYPAFDRKRSETLYDGFEFNLIRITGV